MENSDGPRSQMRAFIFAFLRHSGLPSKDIVFQALPGDGSKRLFWRVSPPEPGQSYIAMESLPGDLFSRRENLAYLMIGRHLFQKGLPVPQIYRFDMTRGWFIMEDMGSRSLQDAAASPKGRIPLYERVTEILIRLQIEGSQGFNTAWCCQTERYDRFVMRRYETDYFRDAFLCNYLGLRSEWPELEGPFKHLADTALNAESHYFLHRDFQSRNIMTSDGEIGILDWQGARLGPLPYDLASLLIDPYADLSINERNHIYRYYLALLKDCQSKGVPAFEKYFPYLAIQRNLQILGAFSYLTRVRRKPHFEPYLSPAVKSLRDLLDELKDPKLAPLRDLLDDLPPIRRSIGVLE